MNAAKHLFWTILFAVFLGGCASVIPSSGPRNTPASVTSPAGSPPAPPSAATARAPATTTQRAPSRSAETLLQALAMSGFDYRYGGKSVASGFDCSGLVAHVFKQAYGMELPHNSKAQAAYGKPVQAAQLEPGDLVFFNTLKEPFSHVGIYLGDDRFIHAPKAGAVVRTENMRLAYWRTRFDGARRLVN